MLNIAKTIYACWNTAYMQDDLQEAELIPFGNSKNEQTKLSKVTKKYTNLSEHDNKPLPGFTLYKTSRKHWGSIDQTWLVIDPRGFLVRITSKNLENILHVTGITEGLIQEKCVWARENLETKLTLVPINSCNFTEAVQNTELIESKVALKDVQIGDTVLLQNKMTGIYKGVVSLYSQIDGYAYTSEYKPITKIRKQIIEVNPGKYYYQSDLKILKILNKIEAGLTREESVIEMNNHIKNGTAAFSNSSYGLNNPATSYLGLVRHVSAHALAKVPLTVEEINVEEATMLFETAKDYSDVGVLMLENNKGEKFIIDFPYNAHISKVSINGFDVVKLKNLALEKDIKLIPADTRRTMFRTTLLSYKFEDFDKFYKIVKHVKNIDYI
jgi:hypothetical protein